MTDLNAKIVFHLNKWKAPKKPKAVWWIWTQLQGAQGRLPFTRRHEMSSISDPWRNYKKQKHVFSSVRFCFNKNWLEEQQLSFFSESFQLCMLLAIIYGNLFLPQDRKNKIKGNSHNSDFFHATSEFILTFFLRNLSLHLTILKKGQLFFSQLWVFILFY